MELNCRIVAYSCLPSGPKRQCTRRCWGMDAASGRTILTLTGRLRISKIITCTSSPTTPATTCIYRGLKLPADPCRSIRVLSGGSLFERCLERGNFGIPGTENCEACRRTLTRVSDFEFPMVIGPISSSKDGNVGGVASGTRLGRFMRSTLSCSHSGEFLVRRFVIGGKFRVSKSTFDISKGLIFRYFKGRCCDRGISGSFTPLNRY